MESQTPPPTPEQDVKAYLQAQENKSLLRFITCGSVDDGKSTLIGRLLYEAHLLFDDQLDNLHSDSKAHGTQGDGIDFALLVDGLAAEREQGITIDVAYRYFSTTQRKFIVADTPGHEQYTRNMATAASTADCAILLIDARQGVLTQTRRHAIIASLLGVRSVVLAINKMDLVAYSQDTYDSIVAAFNDFAQNLDFAHCQAIPLSALCGDNITTKSEATPWYKGDALLPYLESVPVVQAQSDEQDKKGFRLPVQSVLRPHADFRGFSGTCVAGQINTGDKVRVLQGSTGNGAGSGATTQIKDILTPHGLTKTAGVGEALTLTFTDEIDASRGNLIVAADDLCEETDQLEAHLLWMSQEAMLPGRSYIFKLATQNAVATLNPVKHKLNINTLEQLPTKTLALNEIGLITLSLNKRIVFEPYEKNRALGSFILIDRISNHTVGAGMINFALRRADNIHWHAAEIDKDTHAAQKGQKPAILWFTGLSGSGKSTIANHLQKKLFADNYHSTILDGDNIRHGLNRDLGFTQADRVENIRRVAEVSRLMLEAGLFTLVSFISPFRAERRLARDLVEAGAFIEIFVDTPLAVAEARDPKGLYKKARKGEIKNFTGLDSPYESPETAEISIDTTALDAEAAAQLIYDYLLRHGYIKK